MSILEDIVKENEDVLKRILTKVSGAIILSDMGIALQTSFDTTTTQGYARLIAGTFTDLCRSLVRDMDPEDDLSYIRIKTKNNEIIVAPQKEFTIISVQK